VCLRINVINVIKETVLVKSVIIEGTRYAFVHFLSS